MTFNTPEIHKLLELIASKDYHNIVLALTIDKSVGVDIVQELLPFPMHDRLLMANSPSTLLNQEAYERPFEDWDNATKASLFLQKGGLLINNFSEARHYDALVFCQNLTKLVIDFKGQIPPTDFNFLKLMHLEHLELQNCPQWLLTERALTYLSKQGLKTLILTSSSKEPSTLIVPKIIGQLKSLQQLYLEHFGVITLPEEILELSELNELYLHNGVYELQVPNKLLSLPHLQHASLNDIPNNTLPYLNPNVELSLTRTSLSTIFKLMAWNRSYTLKNTPIFGNSISLILYGFLRFGHILLKIIPSSSNILIFYLRAFLLGVLTLFLLPLLVIYFVLNTYGKLPNLYLSFLTPQKRYGIVYWIANTANPRPSSIEGIGDIGCLGVIALSGIFLWQDFLVPFVCRYLFLPLAIIFYPIDLLIGVFVRR